jgi:hypothetical protein
VSPPNCAEDELAVRGANRLHAGQHGASELLLRARLEAESKKVLDLIA